MEKMKMRFTNAVAAKLVRAPHSTAKAELIEELADNLYRRFLEMTGAGVPEEDAFKRSMDDLGDVDELLSYLGVDPAPQQDVAAGQKDGQAQGGQPRIDMSDPHRIVITREDGQRVIINNADENTVVNLNSGEEPDTAREGADAAREETEAAREGQTDGQDAAYGDPGAWASQSDLDAILSTVTEACRTAMDQARDAVRQAKTAMKRRTTVQRDKNHVKVHFDTTPDVPPAPPVPPVSDMPEAPPAPGTPPAPPSGWEFEAELDSDEGRFFAAAGPKEKKDVIYGFGYDKAKGGFFTQWGEWDGEGQDHTGPRFTGENGGMHPNDDGSYSVTALKDLRGIEVFTTAGDVSLHISEAPDAGVIIDGDVDDLDVTCSADGVLTIREGRTASSSFFSRRGFCSANVELYLPRRHWETITVQTASGDVDIDQDSLDVGQLAITTASGNSSLLLGACGSLDFSSASGDLELTGDGLDIDQVTLGTASGDCGLTLRSCGTLEFNSASGDLELNLEHPCGQLRAKTMSGDVNLNGTFQNVMVNTTSGDLELNGDCGRLRAESKSGSYSLSGQMGTVQLKTLSGDIELEGLVEQFQGSSVSGDVRVEVPMLPQAMALSSKSGDVEASLPDAGPFSANMKTTTGEIDCQFRMNYVNGVFIYGDGSGPAYSMTTVSGDVSLERH